MVSVRPLVKSGYFLHIPIFVMEDMHVYFL